MTATTAPARKDRWTRRWKVQGTGHEWIVAIDAAGAYGCSCPVWKFRREECHHIAAVKRNPDAYNSETPPVMLPIIPAKVAQVEIITLEDGTKAYGQPLVPIGDTNIRATILYDLLRLGYSWGQLRERFERSGYIPHQWTARAVVAHVERHGRHVYTESAMRNPADASTYVVPVTQ